MNEEPTIVITDLLFLQSGKGYFMCNIGPGTRPTFDDSVVLGAQGYTGRGVYSCMR